MKFSLGLINWNLVVLLGLGAASGGCATRSERDQEIATIRLHFEANPAMVRRSMEATVLRAHPVTITVAEEPLVHEGYLDAAEIVTTGGTHQLRLTFDDSGRRLLETETAIHRGKRVAVIAQFPEARWLGAPVITGTIRDGVFVFTPDASLEECRRLVDGLNRVIQDRKRNDWLK